MIVVLNSLKKSSDRTFLLAVSILDRVFSKKQEQHVVMKKQDLHLYGLASIFIASKMEDSIPIFMNELIKDAAHDKFTIENIRETEMDILRTLEYKTTANTILDIAAHDLKKFLLSS